MDTVQDVGKWWANVDWLTLTRPETGVAYSAALDAARWLWADGSGETSGILDEKDWAWLGYKGVRIGSACVGTRPDGTIFRVSGGLADKVSDYLLTGSWKPSRIDVALTYVTGEAIDDLIRKHADESRACREQVHSRPWKVSLIQSFGDGDTLTLGSRTTNAYARVYNKYAESGFDKGYEGCIRYELEAKGGLAPQVMRNLNDRGWTSQSKCDIVCTAMMRRGLSMPANLSHSKQVLNWYENENTDVDKKLEWLRRQVRPTVAQLKIAGYEDLALQALQGLEDE